MNWAFGPYCRHFPAQALRQYSPFTEVLHSCFHGGTLKSKNDGILCSVRGYMYAVYCKAAYNKAGALQSYINV